MIECINDLHGLRFKTGVRYNARVQEFKTDQ